MFRRYAESTTRHSVETGRKKPVIRIRWEVLVRPQPPDRARRYDRSWTFQSNFFGGNPMPIKAHWSDELVRYCGETLRDSGSHRDCWLISVGDRRGSL